MGFRNNFGIWHGLVIPRSKDQTYTTVMGPYNKFQRLKRLYKQSIKLLMALHGARDTLGGLTNNPKNHSRYQGKVSVLKEQYRARKM